MMPERIPIEPARRRRTRLERFAQSRFAQDLSKLLFGGAAGAISVMGIRWVWVGATVLVLSLVWCFFTDDV